MTPDLQFSLLGPLLVRQGETVVPIRPGKQRTVLAVLLLRGRQIVPVDDIAEALWGPAPPPSARVGIRNYIKQLRRALGDNGQGRIRTEPPGYLIQVDAGEFDVSQFAATLVATRA